MNGSMTGSESKTLVRCHGGIQGDQASLVCAERAYLEKYDGNQIAANKRQSMP